MLYINRGFEQDFGRLCVGLHVELDAGLDVDLYGTINVIRV